jgi:hypothetical protein
LTTPPSLSWDTVASAGAAKTPIALGRLTISIPVGSTDTLQSLFIGGLPPGAILTDGFNIFTAGIDRAAADVTNWNLSDISIAPATAGAFFLTATATTQDAQGVVTSATANELVTAAPAPATTALVTLAAAATTSPATPSQYSDGSANAPAGSTQLPTLLDGYAVRPPWAVAGVDYAVGVPAGMTLLDPATISMAGVEVDLVAHLVTVTGNNVTLNGYDFGPGGGWGISVEGNATNTIIENCNFLAGSTQLVPINGGKGIGDLTVLNNTIDGGGGLADTVFALISYAGSGTFVAQYNSLLNSPEDAIDFTGSHTGSMTTIVEYNLFQVLGTSPGNHSDSVQYSGVDANNAVVAFNTIYQTIPSGLEGIQLSAQGVGSTLINSSINNNVLIARGPDLTMSYSIAVLQEPGNTIDGVIVGNNYIDSSDAFGPIFFPIGGTNLTYTGNVDMPSGTAIPAPPGATAASDVRLVTAAPGSGILTVGNTMALTVKLDEAFTVTGTPTLTLNDNGIAIYAGGSGTNALTFNYTVSLTDLAVSALGVTGVVLPTGSGIRDVYGNPAHLAGAVTTISGLGVNPGILCFVAGTLIATPNGEVAVEHLSVGNAVVTFGGEVRHITWIGVGQVRAKRGKRSAATPVIVRKGALGDNIPHHDLHITKGHSLYIDDVLIPVEFLVNYRSIVWDDRAQEVKLFHVELATHDVLLANGALAESYRDDGNRWLFQNANTGWGQLSKPAYAPVLTGGTIVDAVWRRLLSRAGKRPGVATTEDPDLHLVVDGKRVDGKSPAPQVYVFRLPRPLTEVRLVSRGGVPAELGLARDPRPLGVAVRRILLWKGSHLRVIEASDPALDIGFHPFEEDNVYRWTDGDAQLPVALFDGSAELELHVGQTTTYQLFHDDAHVAG